MTEWTMNRSSLEKGMLIRRPGLDEALEVVNVRNGQAKVKLPDGKTSTIPASAEVEWSWPENRHPRDTMPKPLPAESSEPQTEDAHLGDDGKVSEWQTDWSMLDVGKKIAVLGETGDFTVLRLTDSSARIKHNATGQIQPLSIGHKFKLLDNVEDKAKTPSKTKDKSKASKKPPTETPQQPLVEPETDPEPEDGEIDEAEEPYTGVMNTEPSDEVLTAIENGDSDDDEAEPDYDPEKANRELDREEDNDEADDDETENGDEEFEEINTQIATEKETPRMPKSNRSTSLLTLGQISERTGISYPTLVRYVRDHGHRLPSEGEGRSRRFLPEAVDVFREIRSETKGGRKPGAGAGKGSGSSPKLARKAKPATRSHETAAPYAASPVRKSSSKPASAASSNAVWVPSSGQTIDQILTAAIEQARTEISTREALIENLEAQREALKLWS